MSQNWGIMDIIRLVRPHQYIKNLFIFLPLFFASRITDPGLLGRALVAFLAFSLVAGAVYILNDSLDIEEDRRHPRKKYRPLASGAVTIRRAMGFMTAFALAGGVLMASVSLQALFILLLYVALNIAYSFSLKHVAILDVTIIATGFVLRLFVGSMATGVELSMWIVTMTFLLAMFLALAKRRNDVQLYLDTGKKTRKAVDGYNLRFLDTAMAVMASVVIVAYTIYTTSAEVVERVHSDHLYLTALFVIIGVMRYLQITLLDKNSDAPTTIVLKDPFMQLTLIGWMAANAWILY